MSKLKGNVSLLSVGFIVGFPLLYAIDPLYPFYIALGIDGVGLIASFFLHQPEKITHLGDEKKVYQSMMSLIGEFFKAKKFLIIACIAGFSWSLYLSANGFREPYLVSVGYPVAWIGLVMGGSRFVWFLLGRLTKYIQDEVAIKTLLIRDIAVLGGGFLIISLLYENWLVTSVLLVCMIGYYSARAPFYTQHLFAVLPNKDYKATFLSIKAQGEGFLGLFLPVMMGYCMAVGYDFGFSVAAILYGALGLVGLYYVRRYGIR